MSTRKQLRIAWECHDEEAFLDACVLAEKILAAAQDREARLDLDTKRSPARATLLLSDVLPQREALMRLWQMVRSWRGSHANEDMAAWQKRMEDIAGCYEEHASLPLAACSGCEEQNLRSAGCKRVRPALGPLDLERPFDVRCTYWTQGFREPGAWRFDKRAIWKTWTQSLRLQGLQYCPRFGGLFTAFALLPDAVSCGPEEAWRLAEAPPSLEDYGEEIAPNRAAVPRDVPIPKGFRRITV